MPKSQAQERAVGGVTKIPLHTIHLSRETGETHKFGIFKDHPVVERIMPEIGKPFDFTQEEHDDIMRRSPDSLRDPTNETGPGSAVENETVDAAVAEAHAEAERTKTAAGDAAVTAAAGAKGKGARKQPDNNNAGEALDDEDTL